ncbi:MAG: polysaccharide biosynthesis tyrosine autokinase [Chitinophagaceae bacterium]|nr:polysaccharide biosynthesis tyrosine autokinase [Chitinophagaceae bacterium]
MSDFPNHLSSQGLPNPSDSSDVFSQEFDITRLIVVFRKNLIWIVLILICSILGAYFFIRYTKPLFESKSQLKLDLNSEATAVGLSKVDPSLEEYSSASKVAGEVEFIKSPLVLKEINSRANLEIGYFALGDILFEERFQTNPFELKYTVIDPSLINQRINITIESPSEDNYKYSYPWKGETIQGNAKFGNMITTEGLVFKINKTPFLQTETLNKDFFCIVYSPQFIEGYISQNLTVEIDNIEARIISVGFKDYNKNKAAYIVNLIDSVYLEKTIELKTSKHEKTLDFLKLSLSKTESNLLEAEQDLESFLKENKSGELKTLYERVYTKIDEFEKEKTALMRQLYVFKDLEESIDKGHELESFFPALVGIQDPQLIKSLQEYNDLRMDMLRIKSSQSSDTYVFRRKQNMLNNSKLSVLNQLSQNKHVLQKEIFEINSAIFKLESQIVDLPTKETELARLKRHYDIYEKFYLLLLEKETEFEIARAGAIPNFVILSQASLSPVPVFPQSKMAYSFAIGFGLLLSLILVLVSYLLDSSLSSLKEIEAGLPLPVLGGIPEYKKERMDISRLVVDQNPKSQISEALRSIRTSLDFMVSTKGRHKTISITSTISGEGKTFVAVNLAGILSQSGLKVVLLDLDMRKPKVHLSFDVSNDKGMSTLLIGKHELSECIKNTSMPNLDFIPSGPTPPNPSELIMRDEFKMLVDKLHETYDIVFIDSPPVGLVTDGILIMKHVDVALYVLRINYSKRSFKANLNKLVQTANFKQMGVIVNAVQNVHTYGYGYGYGYGYYENGKKETAGKTFVDWLKKVLKIK